MRLAQYVRLTVVLLVSLALGFGLALGLLPAAPVAACSCLPPPHPDERFARAAIVFTGVPHAIERVVSDEPEVTRQRLVSVTFEVLSVEKGSAATQIAVRAAEHSASCGATFYKGETYRLYTSRAQDGALSVGGCGGAVELLSERSQDAFRPLSPPPPRPPGPPGELVLAVFIGSLLATGVGLIWLLFREVGRQLD